MPVNLQGSLFTYISSAAPHCGESFNGALFQFMSEQSHKACVDCDHYRTRYVGGEYGFNEAQCFRITPVKVFHPVCGWIENEQHGPSCAYERGGDYIPGAIERFFGAKPDLAVNRCGPDGKFFVEAKKSEK